MGVDTHGIEALRNSAENVSGDSPGSTFVKTLNGWLYQRVGRKVVAAYPSDTTEEYTFMQDSEEHYKIVVSYVDSSKAQLSSVERTL